VNVPEDLRYTASHEWLRLDGDTATVGITDFAQDQLGEVVFVELPAPGSVVEKDRPFGVIESVKAAVDLYAPVSGEVLERNERLADAPELVNQSPYADAWMIRVRIADPAQAEQLLDAARYREMYGE
jgi:glycine cleavage system H protein